MKVFSCGSNAPAGVPIPSPYGDLQLRKTLAGSNDKMISLAPFEKKLLAAIPTTQPEHIVPNKHHRQMFCDKLIGLLGGHES